MARDASLPITVRQITKSYGSVRALDQIDLDIRSGEFLTLLGPSGSGKTTLLMVLAGFTRPDHGSLKFGGWIWRYDLASLGPSETEVTLTYDWSAVPEYIREYIHFPPFGPEHLTNSLHHLAELAAQRSPARTPGS